MSRVDVTNAGAIAAEETVFLFTTTRWPPLRARCSS